MGGAELHFEPTPNSHGPPNPFYSYMLELSAQQVAPRYGGSYTITGGGGEFGDTIAIDELRLPEALWIHELETHARVERAALRLTWTGHGTAPLRVRLSVMPKLADGAELLGQSSKRERDHRIMLVQGWGEKQYTD